MSDKIVAWLCEEDGEITESQALSENWLMHKHEVRELTERQLVKLREADVVKKLYQMAIPSLDPESFVDLEIALKILCETRHIDLGSHPLNVA